MSRVFLSLLREGGGGTWLLQHTEDFLLVSFLTHEDLLLHLLLLGGQLARDLLHDALDARQDLLRVTASATARVRKVRQLLSEGLLELGLGGLELA